MPNRNGTGPQGKGPKTGRGLGSCKDEAPGKNQRGRGLGRGMGLRRETDDNKEKENG